MACGVVGLPPTPMTHLSASPPTDLARYVECVANPIVGVLPGDESQGWEIRVFDQDEPNAFALPGRKIGVYKGLLDVTETQDQLAAVTGHEIGHVLARHGNERMSSQFMVQTGMAGAVAGDTVACPPGVGFDPSAHAHMALDDAGRCAGAGALAPSLPDPRMRLPLERPSVAGGEAIVAVRSPDVHTCLRAVCRVL